MKAFIWSSDYVAHIAVAETKEDALKLLEKEIEGKDKYDKEAFEMAKKDEPVIVEANTALHLNHSNP